MSAAILTGEMQAEGPAGQGPCGAATQASVSALHTRWSWAIRGGGRDEQGAVGQRPDGLALGEDDSIPQPGHVKRGLAGPQMAVQQQRVIRLQHHMNRASTTAQLHWYRLL